MSESSQPVDVWECALGFMNSQILFAAEELSVFDYLAEGAATVEEIAAATELTPEVAERLLTALCALRLIEKTPEERYVNSEEAAEKLVSGRPGYIGSMFHHLQEVLYPAWGDFKEVLLAGGQSESVPSEDVYADPDSLRKFMDGMHSITYAAAQDFAAQAPELEEVTHLVDVGGASGAFLIALAEAFPQLHGTVLDLPQVRPIAEDYFSEHGLEGRLEFYGADFFNDPLPEGADAYALGFILHDWDREDGSYLLEKIAGVSSPGGWLFVGENLLNEDKTGPLFVARSDLNMMLAARGRERTAAEYRDWIAEFGFELERIQSASYGKHYLVARWKP